MRLFYPGQMALPLMLLLAGVALMMDRLDIIQVARWDLWPVALIAAGLEELYLWAAAGSSRKDKQR
jgi:Domain of unknown function (DUF5668)